MRRYRYHALSASGVPIRGEIEAVSEAAVIAALRSQGHLPIRAKPADERLALLDAFARRALFARPLTTKQVATLIERLSALLAAGIAIERALEIESRSADPRCAAVADQLRDCVRRGMSLSAALTAQGASFSTIAIGMVRAGESGGFLPLALARLSAFLRVDLATRERVRVALAYPRFLLIAALCFLLLVLGHVLPQFRPLFADARIELPLSTRLLFELSGVVEQHLGEIIVATLAIALLLRHYIRGARGRAQLARLVLRIPALRALVVASDAGRYARCLGTLAGARVPLPEAARFAAGIVANEEIRRRLAALAEPLASGKSLNHLLRTNPHLPTSLSDLVLVGEQTGRLPEMLERAAEILEREATMRSERFLSLLVPSITVALGLIVAVLIGSVVSVLVELNALAG
jgi:general secretion pathway protein F